jgi:hypothetical protein
MDCSEPDILGMGTTVGTSLSQTGEGGKATFTVAKEWCRGCGSTWDDTRGVYRIGWRKAKFATLCVGLCSYAGMGWMDWG